MARPLHGRSASVLQGGCRLATVWGGAAKEVGEVEEDAAKLTVCSVRAEEGRKMEVDARGGASSGQQWWTTMGEPIPAKEEVGHAHGCLAKVEDQVGCLLAGEIEA